LVIKIFKENIMSKEQRQPSAADLILARQRKAKIKVELEQRWLRLAKEAEEKRRKEMMDEIARRNELCAGIDKRYGFSSALEEINKRVFGGEGEIKVIFPYETTSSIDDNNLGTPLEEAMTRITLDGRGHSMAIEYSPGGRVVITAGLEVKPLIKKVGEINVFYPAGSQGATSESQKFRRELSFKEPNFSENLVLALADAFENSALYHRGFVPTKG